jgi:hypothetical protein
MAANERPRRLLGHVQQRYQWNRMTQGCFWSHRDRSIPMRFRLHWQACPRCRRWLRDHGAEVFAAALDFIERRNADVEVFLREVERGGEP